jgi:hypothetical protein
MPRLALPFAGSSAFALALACGGDPSPAFSVPAPPAAPGASGLELLSFDAGALPAGLPLQGRVVGGARWRDRDGEGLLVLTEVAPHVTKPGSDEVDPEYSAELQGQQFVLRGASWEQVWRIQDFVKDCMFDTTCAHLPQSVVVTDLDGDGVAETSFQYRLSCRSDVSPAEQKLMMHEGAAKYALRGRAFIELEGFRDGGEYTADPAFQGAPPAFLPEAERQWALYSRETFE